MQNYLVNAIRCDKPVGKRADGGRTGPPVSGAGACGSMSMTDFAALLKAFTDHNILTCGVPVDPVLRGADAYKFACQSIRDTLPPEEQATTLSLTKENFTFPNKPGIICFDLDTDHHRPEWAYNSLSDAVSLLERALGISLEPYDYVVKSSSSSFVTGPDLVCSGLKGVHIYLGVTDMSDLASGPSLLDLAASNDMGNVVFNRNQTRLLKRALYDVATLQTGCKQLFSGKPICPKGYTSTPAFLVHATGTPFNLKALPTITRADVEPTWAALSASLLPELKQHTAEYVRSRQKEHGTGERAVRAVLERSTLSDDVILTVKNAKPVSLKTIMTEWPDGVYKDFGVPYDEPEGFGKCIATKRGATFNLFSQAHGGQSFRYVMSPTGLEEHLRTLGDIPFSEVLRTVNAADVEGTSEQLAAVVHPFFKKELPDSSTAKFTATKFEKAMKEIDAPRRLKANNIREEQANRWRDSKIPRYIYLKNPNKFLDVDQFEATGELQTQTDKALDLSLACYYKGASAALDLMSRSVVPIHTDCTKKAPRYFKDPIPDCGDKFNIWRPGPDLTVSDTPIETPCVSQWLELGRHMLGPDFDNLIGWMAWNLQHPGLKGNYQYLLYSAREGVGKDALFAPFFWAVGDLNAYEVDSDRANSNFNAFVAKGSAFLVFNESDESGNKAFAERMKKFAASTQSGKLSVEEKHKPVVEVDNTMCVAILTNNPNTLHVGQKERRWCLLSIPDDWLRGSKPEADAFFAEWFFGDGSKTEEMHAESRNLEVANWLASRDVSDFDAHTVPPDSAFKIEVKAASRTIGEQQLDEYLLNYEPSILNYNLHVRPFNLEKMSSKMFGNLIITKGYVRRLCKNEQGQRANYWLKAEHGEGITDEKALTLIHETEEALAPYYPGKDHTKPSWVAWANARRDIPTNGEAA